MESSSSVEKHLKVEDVQGAFVEQRDRSVVRRTLRGLH